MNKQCFWTVAALALFCPGTVLAEGPVQLVHLVQKLPEDGAWVRFEAEIVSEKLGSTSKATVELKSVGQRLEGDTRCRWIELALPMEDATQTIKLLLPEQDEKRASPLGRPIRGWRKLGDENPRSMLQFRDFWLEVLLPQALQDVTELEEVVISGPLGNLACRGVSGRSRVLEDDGHELDLAYTIRLHEDAPFGVVTYRFVCKVKRQDQHLDTVTYDLKLTDFGRDAKSEMAGYE